MRANFPPSVIECVAGRAGYRCSFPGCERPTIGPGAAAHETSSIGVAAHIYSASPRGPRGQGLLTSEELADLGNAIWLCETHSRIVDANRGDKYPPTVLRGYRDLHEFRVASEMGDLPDMRGWVDEIVVGGGILPSTSVIRLGKATVFRGPNDSGKTMVCDWIAGTRSGELLDRWRDTQVALSVSLHLLHPSGSNTLSLCIQDGVLRWTLDGAPVPVNPLDYRVVYVRESRVGDDTSALDVIASALGENPDTVVGLSPRVSLDSASFVLSVDTHAHELRVHIRGASAPLEFRQLSSGEQSLVVIEYALALANVEAEYRPTLLVIDAGVGVLDNRATERLVARLSGPAFRFQTIVVTTDAQPRFFGWQVYDFTHAPRVISPAYGA